MSRKRAITARVIKPTEKNPVTTRELMLLQRQLTGLQIRYSPQNREFTLITTIESEQPILEKILCMFPERKIYV